MRPMMRSSSACSWRSYGGSSSRVPRLWHWPKAISGSPPSEAAPAPLEPHRDALAAPGAAVATAVQAAEIDHLAGQTAVLGQQEIDRPRDGLRLRPPSGAGERLHPRA